jgi:hypothetical protein
LGGLQGHTWVGVAVEEAVPETDEIGTGDTKTQTASQRCEGVVVRLTRRTLIV